MRGDQSGAEPTPAAAAPADAPEPAGTSEPEPETRAARRQRREALLREPVLSPLATVPRPVLALASVLLAGLLALAAISDQAILAAGLAALGVILAWGWPTLLGSPSRVGSSLAIGVSAVLTAVAVAVTSEPPHGRSVPAAVAAGLVVTFVHQLVRRDGRPRLVASIGITTLGIFLVTVGGMLAPVARTEPGVRVVLAALAGVAAAAVAELGSGHAAYRRIMWLVAMALGAVAALAIGALYAAPVRAADALVGAVCAALAYPVHRILAVLPAVASWRGQLTVAVAGLLSIGVAAMTLLRVLPT